MRLSQLRDFVAIVDAGSVRAAARVQGVSHPAVAKSLRLLETEVGVPLLRRSNHGVACTPAGRVLLTRARAIQAEVRKAADELAQYAGPRGGHLGVGVSPITTPFVSDAVASFLELNPDARLRILTGPPSLLAPLVRDETLDFAIAVRMPLTTGPGLAFRTLQRVPMTIVARRGHPLRGARTLAELADTRWVGLNAPSAGGWLEQMLTHAGVAFPRRYIQCESFSLAAALMGRIDAVMAVPEPMLIQQGRRAPLVAIPLRDALPPIELGVCSRSGTRLTSLAASLARLIADALRPAWVR